MDLVDREFIEKTLDSLIDGIQNNQLNAQDFNNYSKLLKGSFFSNLTRHKASRRCSFPGCLNPSIRRSHSIPKSSSLQSIASNYHLLKPEVDMSRNELAITMKKISINDASVFPGYCSEHEAIFQVFETDGELDENRKALLQSYRTICRERVFREIELEINNEMERIYSDKLEKEALNIFKNAIPQNTIFDNIKDFRIKGGDNILIFFKKFQNLILKQNEPLIEIEEDIHHYLYGGENDSNLLITGVNVDIHLPIALCGFATTGYKEKDEIKTAHVIMNVIPLKDKTYIICITNKRHSTLFEAYKRNFFQNPAMILNMIESFMINGSDHWFINPDYWYKLPIEKQDKILFDILNTTDSFLNEYPISIFDNIREFIINIFLINTKDRDLTAIERGFIEKEQRKLKMKNYSVVKDEDKLLKRLFSKLG